METQPQIFIGIDPGKTGAISVYEIVADKPAMVSIIDYSNPDAMHVLRTLAGRSMFEGCKVMAAIEEVGMRPGQDARRVTTYVIHHGIAQGWLQMLDIPYKSVNPRTWQAAIYKLPGFADYPFVYPDPKPRHLAICRQLFPADQDILAALRRAKDHNRADALLIGYWLAYLMQ